MDTWAVGEVCKGFRKAFPRLQQFHPSLFEVDLTCHVPFSTSPLDSTAPTSPAREESSLWGLQFGLQGS